RFGINSQLPPVLPLALGAAEMTLEEQVSAFTAFPNDGMRVVPRFIQRVEDSDGNMLEQHHTEAKKAIDEQTARRMVSLLEGVVEHGTAKAALALNHPVAGKTGTTNDFTDAWFVGFSPSVTCGVWVGYDTKTTLGPKETGAEAALPIWMDVMKAAVADRPNEKFSTAAP
ncbi:MAG: penicillin-binding protein, partial [Acidobacteriales bacterium]|nr:penicillin-binding protein [Terriglobales bacterium]